LEQYEFCTGVPQALWGILERTYGGARHKNRKGQPKRPTRLQFGYKGVLDARTGLHFKGVPRAKRDSANHDQLIKAQLREQRIEKAMFFEADWLGRSIEEQAQEMEDERGDA
jgi:hypothetical protein